jgi:hypothetical protein
MNSSRKGNLLPIVFRDELGLDGRQPLPYRFENAIEDGAGETSQRTMNGIAPQADCEPSAEECEERSENDAVKEYVPQAVPKAIAKTALSLGPCFFGLSSPFIFLALLPD